MDASRRGMYSRAQTWSLPIDDQDWFPEDKATLGRYLGPAIDVGSMLTAKILMPNGQYVCRLTLRHLNDNECNSEVP